MQNQLINMKKYLLSNWLNVLSILLGLYVIVLSISIYQLFIGKRGFTMETVLVETIGGSFLFFIGAIFYNVKMLLFCFVFIFALDVILFKVLSQNISQIIIIEIICFLLVVVVYSYLENSYIFMSLLPFFIASQQIRKKKNLLMKSDGNKIDDLDQSKVKGTH
jgi:hypothetical protein